MSLAKTITILVALGTACSGIAAAVQAIDPVWGAVLMISGTFLTLFTKSILETEKKDDK
jgi:hypothetical protein